jgi:hypothetical protein
MDALLFHQFLLLPRRTDRHAKQQNPWQRSWWQGLPASLGAARPLSSKCGPAPPLDARLVPTYNLAQQLNCLIQRGGGNRPCEARQPAMRPRRIDA